MSSALARKIPFDDLFEELIASNWGPKNGHHAFFPATDVVEEDGGYRLKADIPGMNANELQIECRDGNLILSGERRFESESNQQGYRRVERRYGSFRRQFSLPDGVDFDAIKADYRDGVLEIWIPKPEATKPRTIKIEGTGESAQIESEK